MCGFRERYSLDDPANRYLFARRGRDLVALLRRQRLLPLAAREIIDVGCGNGALLRDFVRFGADPARCTGIDLLRNASTPRASATPGVTLAPPLTRRLARISPAICRALEALPLLRSHYLAMVRKDALPG